jgi:acyl-coenzyme A thioesterase PaaI-like protein
MQLKPNQRMTDDSIRIGDNKEIRPSLNENWEARRELAEVLRRLNEVLLTTDVPTGELRSLTARLHIEANRIEKNERLFGRSEHREKYYAQHQVRPDLLYEMSPIMGMGNPLALPMHIWQEDGRLHAEVKPGWAFEGPLGRLHGGVIASLFDQILGLAQHLAGGGGLTGNLNIRFHNPTPLNKTLRMTAELNRIEGRKKFITGELWDGEVRTASCEGLFISEKPVPTPTAE